MFKSIFNFFLMKSSKICSSEIIDNNNNSIIDVNKEYLLNNNSIIDVNKEYLLNNNSCWIAVASNMIVYINQNNGKEKEIYNEILEYYTVKNAGNILQALKYYYNKHNFKLHYDEYNNTDINFFMINNFMDILFQENKKKYSIGLEIRWNNNSYGHALFCVKTNKKNNTITLADSDDQEYKYFDVLVEFINNNIYLINYNNNNNINFKEKKKIIKYQPYIYKIIFLYK